MSSKEDDKPLLLKFGLLSVSQLYCFTDIAKLLYLVSYFQLLGILLKTAIIALEDPTNDFMNAVYKVATISDFLNFHEKNVLTQIFVYWAIFYSLSLLVDGSVILTSIKMKRQIEDLMLKYWNFECYAHPMWLYFPIHNICLEVIYCFHEGTLNITGSEGGDIAIVVLVYISCIVNSLVAYSLVCMLKPIIKTPDPFSAKNQYMQLDDFSKKLVLPILLLFGRLSPTFSKVILWYNAFDMIGTSWILFHYLPYYRFDILQLTAGFHSSLTLFAINTVVSFCFMNSEFNTGITFAVVCTILLLPLAVKLYLRKIQHLGDHIFNSNDVSNHYHAVHKKYIYNYYKDKRLKPHEKTKNVDENYFKFLSKNSNVSTFFDADLSKLSEDEIRVNSVIATTFILNKAKETHPKSVTIKIILADHLIKYQGAYLQAYQLIDEVLKNSPSFSVKISAHMIKEKLHKILDRKLKDSEKTKINVTLYKQIVSFSEDLRYRMNKQLSNQTAFWQIFMSKEPDLQKMFQKAEKTLQEREKIRILWKNHQDLLKTKYKQPYMIYAAYLSLANSQSEQARNLLSVYARNASNTKNLFALDELSDSTIYSSDSCNLYVHGSKDKMGIISKSSKSFEKLFGVSGTSSVGKTMNIIMPPFFRSRHDKILADYYETGKTKIVDRTVSMPVLTSSGFLLPCWIHVRISPEISNGIQFCALLKMRRNDDRIVLVKEDGSIDGFSQDFSEDLNPQTTCISELCPEFEEYNDRFNAIARRMAKDSLMKRQNSVIKARYKKSGNSTSRGSFTSASVSKQETINTERLNLIDGGNKSEETERTFRPDTIKLELTPMSQDAKDQEFLQGFRLGQKMKFYHSRQVTLQTQREIMQQKLPFYVEYLVKVEIITVQEDFIKVLTMKRLTEPVEKSHNKTSSSSRNNISGNKTSIKVKSRQTLDKPVIDSPNKNISIKTASFGSVGSLQQVNDYHSEDFDFTPEIGRDENISQNITQHVMKSVFCDQEASHGMMDESMNDDILVIPQNLVVNEPVQKPTQVFLSSVSYYSHESDPVKFKAHLKHDMEVFDTLNNLVYKRYLQPRDIGMIEELWNNLKKKVNNWILNPFNINSNKSKTLNSEKIAEIVERALLSHKMTKSMKFLFGFYLLIMFYFLISLIIFNTNILTSVWNAQFLVNTAREILMTATFGAQLGNSLLQNTILNRGDFSLTGNFTLDVTSILTQMSNYIEVFENSQQRAYELMIQLEPEHLGIFFEKNIRIREPDQYGNLNFLSMNDFVQTSKKLTEQAISAWHTNQVPDATSEYENKNSAFFFVNFKDDYAIIVIEISKSLQKFCISLMNDVLTNNSIVFSTNFCLIIAFLAYGIKNMHEYGNESLKFTSVLLKFPLEQAHAIDYSLTKFHDIINSHFDFKFYKDLYACDIERKMILKKKAPSTNRKASMASHYLAIQKIYATIIPFVLVVIGISSIFYARSVGLINEGKSLTKRSVASSKVLFDQSMFNPTMSSFFNTNGTYTIKNITGRQALLDAVDYLQNSNAIVDQFRSDSGELSQLEQKIFFNITCEELREFDYLFSDIETHIATCKATAGGMPYVSLVTLYQQIASLTSTTMHIWDLLNGNWTEFTENYLSVATTLPNLFTTAGDLLFILIESVYQGFNHGMDYVRAIGSLFIALAVVCDAFIGIFTGNKVIMRIIRMSRERKKVLMLIPPEMLVANTFLRTYLIQNSNSDINLNIML